MWQNLLCFKVSECKLNPHVLLSANYLVVQVEQLVQCVSLCPDIYPRI